MKVRTALRLLLPALLLLACHRKPATAKADPYGKDSAPILLARAKVYLQNGKWEEGRRMLRSIEERLPSSSEFPQAKLLIGDSFFYSATPSYPEAVVEYKSYLNYFPRSDKRDYVLFRIALCHFAAIEGPERDQAETHQAISAFQDLLREAPGSTYAVESKAMITQCWRRLAESELMVGVFYVNARTYAPAERRLKSLLETYPDYVDRERAYYYLAEALRRKGVDPDERKAFQKRYLAEAGKEDMAALTREENERYQEAYGTFSEAENRRNQLEARGYYEKLVESYPSSPWAQRASDRLVEMGRTGLKEELDS
jgi:outer membrane protein assembly factor BamD